MFYTPTTEQRSVELLNKVASAKLYQVTDAVLAKLSDTQAPQGLIAVAGLPENNLKLLPDRAATAPLVVLDRVQDPGNLGTMIRTADAVGAAAVLLLGGSVDVYSPKVVRASMGSLFHVPVIEQLSEKELLAFCRERGYQLAVTTLEASQSLYTADLRQPLALVIGNEANGVSASLQAQALVRLRIPMPGRAESLNAAMAAGIVLFERLRQQQANT